MSLKRRNYIAWILLAIAAVCWVFGQQKLHGDEGGDVAATTHPTAPQEYHQKTEYANTTAATEYTSEGNQTVFPTVVEARSHNVGASAEPRADRLVGTVLSFAAGALAVVGIFLLRQKDPLCGPDGIFAVFAFYATVSYLLQRIGLIQWSPGFRSTASTGSQAITAWIVLMGVRELFGWVRAGCSLSWCMARRISGRFTKPQISLLMLVGWIVMLLGMFFWLAMAHMYILTDFLASFYGYLVAALFGLVCLWKYGADLNHFQKQLDCFQQGQTITVGNGLFAETEAQLLDVQARHEEAVRTAVTSERFKVELIANVSHDLRTPLTSILGYSELLQKESLSPDGQEQLRRLYEKAGYMNDLVESLFELTKVSSGVIECKKQRIDLIRLLEQTVGLFDDRLVQTGLTVKRNYMSEAVPVVTDGARMHQVFANLLGNAIKYALTGTRIYLEVQETENSCCVRIVNTASYEMDFKPDEIIQRFARGDKARSTKGSGLGLAIAQTYTQSVGGTFRVGVDGDQFSAIVELPKTERNL
ncbi:MAG: HAMP domain-containing histidine kinase [Ruminococcaceae bacterium]|nr:HAMP domain-containing histidine kinase [Oscillospiraceae bacterium]